MGTSPFSTRQRSRMTLEWACKGNGRGKANGNQRQTTKYRSQTAHSFTVYEHHSSETHVPAAFLYDWEGRKRARVARAKRTLLRDSSRSTRNPPTMISLFVSVTHNSHTPLILTHPQQRVNTRGENGNEWCTTRQKMTTRRARVQALLLNV